MTTIDIIKRIKNECNLDASIKNGILRCAVFVPGSYSPEDDEEVIELPVTAGYLKELDNLMKLRNILCNEVTNIENIHYSQFTGYEKVRGFFFEYSVKLEDLKTWGNGNDS